MIVRHGASGIRARVRSFRDNPMNILNQRAPRFPGAPAEIHVLGRRSYTSFTFLSGRLRTGLPVAAKIAFITAGVTTQIVGSPTPPQKS
jgi:hypothetical protein